LERLDEGGRVNDIRLRYVSEADLPILFEHQRDAEALRMAAFSGRDWPAFVEHWTKLLADQAHPVRTVLCDGDVAGNIATWSSGGKQLVGYWIGKPYWGRGIATKALREFLAVVAVRPLYAYVARHNAGSIRVLEKCGFTVSVEDTESLPPPADGVEEVVLKLTEV
jgi:RimJ/RimL family protein N-acetyltransferase